MSLQFDKLFLSRRQPVLPNNDPADKSERFFWTDGLLLLKATEAMLRQLPELDVASRAAFWQGKVLAEWLKWLPSRQKEVPAERIVEYGRAWESQRAAIHILTIKARSEKLAPNGQLRIGGLRIDAKSYALHLAKCWKTVGARGLPQIIARAAEENDVQFFKRLGRALGKKEPEPEVDWSGMDNVTRFLVSNWCRPSDYAHWLPALCFFSDPALAKFCRSTFQRNEEKLTPEALRKTRSRLGLKPVRWPKIRQLTVKNGEMIFA